MRYNRSHKPRLTDGCLFASGHQGPTVDAFERFASRAVFSCPLSSEAYALR
jgi:hypothetical protein